MDKFVIYKHEFILQDGAIGRRQFIVLKKENGSLQFTDFGKYIKSSKAVQTPANDGGNQFKFVVQMLNYVFGKRYVRALNEITIDMVQEFLQAYASGSLDNRTRTKATVDMCVNSVLSFLYSMAEDKNLKTTFTKEDLFKTKIYRSKNNKVETRKIPVFEVIANTKENTILRDIPEKIFNILFNRITFCHPELLGLFMLQAFAGLRPSEACNVRREDSPLGAGIQFSLTDNEPTSIRIDLRKEINLRSDNLFVGYIKKERMAEVPMIFLQTFYDTYKYYLEYLKKQPTEEDFKAFSTNIQGKAITYPSYYEAFNRIVKEEIVPICLDSEDPEIVNYGRILMEHNLSPHALRHWYSVQLTLAGYSAPELMHARGDKSVESALTYIQNKGELEKVYTKVTNNLFSYLDWAAERNHDSK